MVEPRSDYRTLIEQARDEQIVAQAMRARLLAEREQARLVGQGLTSPQQQGPVEQPRWEPAGGQWIDDVGEGWE